MMWDSVDAKGINEVPVRGNNPFFIIFYIFLVIILCLLFVNMFVRIVIETYNIEKDFLDFNRLLTQKQRSWIHVQNMTYSIQPIKLVKAESRFILRLWSIKLTQTKKFELFIMVCILLNTVLMSLVWFD